MPDTFQVDDSVIVTAPDHQPNAIRPVMQDFSGFIAAVYVDGTVDVLDQDDVLFDDIPIGCVALDPW